MANFGRSGILIITAIIVCSLLVFKNFGWNSWNDSSKPLTNFISPSPRKDLTKKNQRHDIKKYLKPPNRYRTNKNADQKYSQAHQDKTVYNILPIDGGFFVEIGAFNGILFSNTLWLERKHNWTGLLIEANPDLCRQVDGVKRMAWRLCACISKELDSIFMKGGALGGVKDTLNEVIARSIKGRGQMKVPCFTLSEALAVIGVRKIDYFSLDVEGAELIVLDSMMEDLLTRHIMVKIWTIEYRIYDGHKMIKSESLIKLNKIRSYFARIGGYTEHLQLNDGPAKKASSMKDGEFLDVMFVRNELYQEYCLRNLSVVDENKCKNATKRSLSGEVKTKSRSSELNKYLKQPNPYHVVNKADTKYSQAHQDETVYNVLPIDGGFFVEIGAFNGVQFSNTLWLERKHNWTGLLIEANPDLCRQVDGVKRMAWRLCACISKEHDSIFMKGGALGGVKDTLNEVIASSIKGRGQMKVPCFTIAEALAVIGVKQIDYFSLDVEGAELIVLDSMMEDLLTRHIIVKIWTIEYRIYDGRKMIESESLIKLNKIRSYFAKIGGYTEHLQLDNRPAAKAGNRKDGDFLDVVFVQNELYQEYCKRNSYIPDGNNCNKLKIKK